MENHQKLFISIRYWLLGASEFDKSFFVPLKALEYASSFHNGKRKDGVTPEFNHQLSIAQQARGMLKGLSDPATTLATIFLHDTSEDYDIGIEELESLFGSKVANCVKLVTKKFRGKEIPVDTYFSQIANDPVASIVKGLDRINNIQTMIGVFSLEKQKKYIDEVNNHFLPMLKIARRNFPEQEGIYMSIKQMLISQCSLILAIHDSVKENK